MGRLRNLLGAAPLVLWYGWGLSREIPVFIENYHTSGALGNSNGLFVLQVLAQFAGIAFTCFLIILLIVRTTPKSSLKSPFPYLAAFTGTFAVSTLYFLPSVVLPPPLLVVAVLCTIAGLVLSLITLAYLGRSFAILPAARRLVTDGPYRFVRHPLYVFEEISVLGIMIQFAQPWALLVVAVHLMAQFARIQYEERALGEAFPSYATYAAHTKRLIPGVY